MRTKEALNKSIYPPLPPGEGEGEALTLSRRERGLDQWMTFYHELLISDVRQQSLLHY